MSPCINWGLGAFVSSPRNVQALNLLGERLGYFNKSARIADLVASATEHTLIAFIRHQYDLPVYPSAGEPYRIVGVDVLAVADA